MKGVDPVVMQDDWGECEAYSEQVIVAQGAARGAAVGAVAGAASGAISGDAASGAGYGAIWGATRSGVQGSKEQENVFKRCMRGRGYRVLN
jgi:outer membrane lipoprotein SlyB